MFIWNQLWFRAVCYINNILTAASQCFPHQQHFLFLFFSLCFTGCWTGTGFAGWDGGERSHPGCHPWRQWRGCPDCQLCGHLRSHLIHRRPELCHAAWPSVSLWKSLTSNQARKFLKVTDETERKNYSFFFFFANCWIFFFLHQVVYNGMIFLRSRYTPRSTVVIVALL